MPTTICLDIWHDLHRNFQRCPFSMDPGKWCTTFSPPSILRLGLQRCFGWDTELMWPSPFHFEICIAGNRAKKYWPSFWRCSLRIPRCHLQGVLGSVVHKPIWSPCYKRENILGIILDSALSQLNWFTCILPISFLHQPQQNKAYNCTSWWPPQRQLRRSNYQ